MCCEKWSSTAGCLGSSVFGQTQISLQASTQRRAKIYHFWPSQRVRSPWNDPWNPLIQHIWRLFVEAIILPCWYQPFVAWISMFASWTYESLTNLRGKRQNHIPSCRNPWQPGCHSRRLSFRRHCCIQWWYYRCQWVAMEGADLFMFIRVHLVFSS